jgi:hypothetical protein
MTLPSRNHFDIRALIIFSCLSHKSNQMPRQVLSKLDRKTIFVRLA